jgi:phytoene desaturase
VPADPVIVMGAGFGGLAAAVRLRVMGYPVLVLEADARRFQRDGFGFDAGPTVVTAPYLFDELFRLAGRDPSDHYQLLPVDPYYRVLFQDGTAFDYVGEEARLLDQIAALSPSDVDGYRRLAAQARRIFDVGYLRLADQPFDRFTDMLRVVPEMIRLGSYRSVHSLVAHHIKDERLRQAFSFQPLLIGGNPFRAPSIYLLVHWLERRWGIHFARGGTSELVRALLELLAELGVEVRTGSAVGSIEIEKGKARAVHLEKGGRIPCSLLVCNADPSMVYTRMIDPRHRRRHTDRAIAGKTHSMSLFVLYFATRKTYPALAQHSIIMGPRYRGLLRDIFQHKVLARDFSLYLHAPARTDPGAAPPGHDVFYALSPVPNQQSGIDWDKVAPVYRERIIDALEGGQMPGLRQNLVTGFSADPRYFEHSLRSYVGAAFGLEPRLGQSAYFRYHNRSQDVAGLYFVGAGVHPGAGLPGVLSSARVLEKLLPRPGRPLALPERKRPARRSQGGRGLVQPEVAGGLA